MVPDNNAYLLGAPEAEESNGALGRGAARGDSAALRALERGRGAEEGPGTDEVGGHGERHSLGCLIDSEVGGGGSVCGKAAVRWHFGRVI